MKGALIWTIIGAMLPVAVGGLAWTDAPAVGAVQAPRSFTDSAWYFVMWWSLPLCIMVLLGVFVYRVMATSASGRSKADPLKKEFDQWRIQKLFGTPTAEQTAEQKPKIHWLTLADALTQSKDRKWIVGQASEQQPNREQSRQAVGQLLTVDYQTTQFAILGGSGGGKTSSTGMLLLMYAKKFGLHPIVLDGKDGLDWGPLGDMGIVEWYNMTEDSLKGFLVQLKAIYQERHSVMRQAGVGKIYDLPARNRPSPLFILMEEFGRTWARVNYDKEIALLFDDLFCLGRAAGIILCPIEQAPETWTKAMRGNAKTALCYATQGEALKAFGEHYVSELPQRGVFSKGNVFYRAWHTGGLYDMRRLPKIQRRYLVEPSVELKKKVSSTVPPATEALQVVEQSGTRGTVELELEPLVVVPPGIERQFHGSTGNKWGKFCEAMFRYYPEMTEMQLQQAMASVAGGDAEAYKSRAFRGYHRFSPNGRRDKVSGYLDSGR